MVYAKQILAVLTLAAVRYRGAHLNTDGRLLQPSTPLILLFFALAERTFHEDACNFIAMLLDKPGTPASLASNL